MTYLDPIWESSSCICFARRPTSDLFDDGRALPPKYEARPSSEKAWFLKILGASTRYQINRKELLRASRSCWKYSAQKGLQKMMKFEDRLWGGLSPWMYHSLSVRGKGGRSNFSDHHIYEGALYSGSNPDVGPTYLCTTFLEESGFLGRQDTRAPNWPRARPPIDRGPQTLIFSDLPQTPERSHVRVGEGRQNLRGEGITHLIR